MLKRGKKDDNSYSLSGFEYAINSTVQWIFFYRMIFVIIALAAVVFFAMIAWFDSPELDRIKNLAAVLGCGSIVIGIFYAILNYEVNYARYKRDKLISRKQLSFQTASEWQKDTIVNHLKVTKVLYESNKHLIDENKSKEFSEIVEADEKARAAFEDILDENFMKGFFKTIFISYLNDYEFYIQYRRKKYNTPNSWINFTNLATKWRG